MSKGKADRLKERRHKGPSAFEQMRGPNLSGKRPTIQQGLRRPSQSAGWSSGYDGPGKGTW